MHGLHELILLKFHERSDVHDMEEFSGSSLQKSRYKLWINRNTVVNDRSNEAEIFTWTVELRTATWRGYKETFILTALFLFLAGTDWNKERFLRVAVFMEGVEGRHSASSLFCDPSQEVFFYLPQKKHGKY